MKTKKRKILDLTTTAATGEILDFGNQVSAPEDISVGMTAIILQDVLAETPQIIPSGDYVMPDGSVWTFDQGKLTKMVSPEPVEGTETLGPKVAAIKMKGKMFIAKGKKFIPLCTGIRLRGKLYLTGIDGKYNVLAKDQKKVKVSRSGSVAFDPKYSFFNQT